MHLHSKPFTSGPYYTNYDTSELHTVANIQTACLAFTEWQFQPCQFGRLEKAIQMDSQPRTGNSFSNGSDEHS